MSKMKGVVYLVVKYTQTIIIGFLIILVGFLYWDKYFNNIKIKDYSNKPTCSSEDKINMKIALSNYMYYVSFPDKILNSLCFPDSIKPLYLKKLDYDEKIKESNSANDKIAKERSDVTEKFREAVRQYTLQDVR